MDGGGGFGHSLLLTACGSLDGLDLMLRGGSVQRFHSEGRHFRQDVAQHTWRVMVVMRALWPDTKPEALLAVLYHDVGEALTGDIPAPVKRNPEVRKAINELDEEFMRYLARPPYSVPSCSTLTPIEHARMKCADYIEMCLTCMDTPGKEARRVYENGIRFIRQAAERLGEEDQRKVEHVIQTRLNDGK